MNPGWSNYLPEGLQRKLRGKNALQQVLANISWLVVDNLVRMLVGVLVGAWVARYLGPEKFGGLAYAVAFVAFFQIAAKLGLDTISVRELSTTPDDAPALLGSILRLRLAAGVICWFLAVIGIGYLQPDNFTGILLVAILAGTVVFQSGDTIDLWFQSRTQSKRTAIARISAVLPASILKIILILSSAPLLGFAIVLLLEAAFTTLAMFLSYRRFKTKTHWTWQWNKAKSLVNESWPYLLSGLAILVYSRIDQLMIHDLIGERELGMYSAAIPLSMAWYFIPMVICTSVGPSLARKKSQSETEYNVALERLFSIMWWYSIPLSLVISLLASPLIHFLYGSEFSESSSVLAIHIFVNIPVALGVAQSLWITNERRGIYSLYRTLLGAVMNIVLNLYLIPRYGVIGAAWATVIASICASFGSNIVMAPQMFLIQIRSLFRYR